MFRRAINVLVSNAVLLSIAAHGQLGMPVCAKTSDAGDKAKPAAAVKKEPIRIGWIASMSGSGKFPSELLLSGAQLYLDQIHHQMAGRPVVLTVENDETNPATAVAKCRKLVEQDKVHLINGIFFSHIAYALLPHAEEYKVPIVIATAAGDDVTQRKRNRWFTRTSY